jgi:hypothetical protein
MLDLLCDGKCISGHNYKDISGLKTEEEQANSDGVFTVHNMNAIYMYI